MSKFYNVKVNERPKRLPRVSTLLSLRHKPWMGPWMCKEMGNFLIREIHDCSDLITLKATIDDVVKEGKGKANEKASEARGVGEKAHEAIEHYLKTGELVDESVFEEGDTDLVEGLTSYRSFKKFIDEYSLETISVEHIIYNVSVGYGGRFDFLGKIRKAGEKEKWRTALIDFKTSASLYDDYALQLSAYYFGLKDEFDLRDIDIVAAVLCRKDKVGYQMKKYSWDEIHTAFHQVIALADLHHAIEDWELLHERRKKK